MDWIQVTCIPRVHDVRRMYLTYCGCWCQGRGSNILFVPCAPWWLEACHIRTTYVQHVASKIFNDNSKYPWVHLTFLKIHSVLAAMAAAALSSLVSLISASPDPVPCFPLTMAQNGRLDVWLSNIGSKVPPKPRRKRLSVWEPPNQATKEGPNHQSLRGSVVATRLCPIPIKPRDHKPECL
jgi:hypothetical protein